MGLPTFRKIHSTADELNEVQDNLKAAIDPLSKHVLLNGNLLRQVSLTTGQNRVSHGLGRRFLSWVALNPSAVASLTAATSEDPSTFLAITASAPVVCDLLVI